MSDTYVVLRLIFPPIVARKIVQMKDKLEYVKVFIYESSRRDEYWAAYELTRISLRTLRNNGPAVIFYEGRNTKKQSSCTPKNEPKTIKGIVLEAQKESMHAKAAIREENRQRRRHRK